jgi:ANTAR domain
MSSAFDSRSNGNGPAADLLRIALPSGTPEEARVAVERLVETTRVLARRSAQLQEALDSRVVIEQAKGILGERYEVDMDEAFQLLRRAARSNRITLHDLARRVVQSRQTPPELSVVGLPGLTGH